MRVHTDPAAAASVQGVGALAYTIGNDVAFAPRAFAPDTRSGARLLAHELTHVLQHQQSHSQAVIHRQPDPAPVITPPAPGPAPAPGPTSAPAPQNIGTFVLDPALDILPPPMMTTHVRVAAPPGPGPLAPAEQYVSIERPVRSTALIKVFAVRLQDVFNNPAEASTTVASEAVRILPDLRAGDPAWTASGMFTVTGVTDGIVFGDTPVPETTGAGTVILVETDGGSILIDAGLQLRDRTLAEPIGAEIAHRLGQRMLGTTLGEAVLMPGAPNGHSLPTVAEHFAVTNIRATADQYSDPRVRGTIEAVQRAQGTYLRWLETSLRQKLTADREQWEATQAIATNAAIHTQRWQRHLEQAVAEALGRVPPPALLPAVDTNGTLELPAGAAPLAPAAAPPTGALLDMTDLSLKPVDDELLIVTGGGTFHVFGSRGLLMRPVPASVRSGGAGAPSTTAPSTTAGRTVPGLRATGPTGPTPAAARTATRWVNAPAVGKSALVLVRTGNGPAVVVDAGSPTDFLPEGALERMITELGVTKVDSILVTHPHDDHLRNITDLIESQGIRAERFVTSANWNRAGSGPLIDLIAHLRQPTRRLIELGYGPDWTPGAAIGSQGVSHATVAVAGGEVDIYTRGQSHEKIRENIRLGEKVSGKTLDSSSLLYVLKNETSPHRVAVLGDLRGTDILALAGEMGEAQFARAMTGVRVLVGFGHHMGLDAGSTPADVRGYEMLFRTTLLTNGELTIVVQSTPEFAFGRTAEQAPRGRALLEFATLMGARVVFAGEPGPQGGGAIISSDLTIQTHGAGVTIYEGDLRVRGAIQRLNMLREARRTVAADAEVGPQFLRLGGTAADIQATLTNEIGELETLLNELLLRRGADLLDARGQKATSASTRAEFRAEPVRNTSGLTIEQLQERLTQKGPLETSLAPEVLEGLRAAAQHGSTLSIEAELLSTPRGVSEAIGKLPEARRSALETQYRELTEAVKALSGGVVPEGRRLELLQRVEALRNELRQLAAEVTGEARAPVDVEIQRLNSVGEELMKDVETQTVTGRDVEGRLTHTEYRMERPPDRIDKAFAQAGRVFGVMMVVHSIEGLAQTAASAQAGKADLPEVLFKTAHAAHSFSIGVRMARMTPVHPGEFAVLAILEVGSILSTDFKTSEERDYALAVTGINQLCMAAGMAIMHYGAAIPHPWVKVGAMALGLAVTLAGPRLLNWLGLDDWLVRATSFAPRQVTHVYQEIDGALNEYEVIIGALALAGRTDSELTALGARNPADMREAAAEAKTRHTSAAKVKESELVGLFEAAYSRAAESYTGLRSLDSLAARFAKLRHLALPGDEATAGLQEAFISMDPQAGRLMKADAETIRGLEQWTKLRSKLYALHDALTADPVKWTNVFEELDEVQQMMDNARYRVDSGSGNRPTPIIVPGTEAYTAYVAQLADHERMLARLLVRAAELGGAGGLPSGLARTPWPGPDAGNPKGALTLLQSLRTAYDERVTTAAQILPALGAPDAWANSFVLGQRLEQAHRAHPGVFNRLRVTEMTLQGAVGQARTAMVTAAGPADPALAALIDREAKSAEKAMEQRRMAHGLVFPNEVDAELVSRRSGEDRSLAAKIDTAYPGQVRPGVAAPVPLSEPEIKALRTEELKDQGGQPTSTEHQLQKAWRLLTPLRSVNMADLSEVSRLERQLVRFRGTSYWTYSPGFFDSADDHTVPSGSEPLLARVGADVIGRKEFYSGPTLYATVLAINADGVKLLGPEVVLVTLADIESVTGSDLESRARRPATAGARP